MTLKLPLPSFASLTIKKHLLVDQPQQKKAIRSFSKKDTDHGAYNVDGGCVIWIIDTTRGQTTSQIITNSIPGIVWHRDIEVNPSLSYLYDHAIEFFNFEGEGQPGPEAKESGVLYDRSFRSRLLQNSNH